MQSRSATPNAADLALTTGIIAGTVTLAAEPDAPPPEWIKLTPRGRTTTRDGRTFDFDPAALATRFAADGIDLPLDTDHSTVLRGGQGESPNTIGYVKALEARDDGTHGRVDWLASGRAVLAARTHRYVSPTIHCDNAGRVTWLHSAALVSAPALTMPAILHAVTQGHPMREIAKALGLAEGADEAACLAALRGRAEVKPLAVALGLTETADSAACLAAVGRLATLEVDLTTTRTQLAAIVKATRDEQVTTMLATALRERRIVPAERESLAKLCASDEGLANVRALLASRAPALGPSGLDGLAAPGADAERDPVRLAAEARVLVDKSGGTLNIADAVMQLTRKG